MGRRLSGSLVAVSDTTQTLTDAATINWDVSKGNIATVTLGGNRAIANPTNLRAGGVSLIIKQDATGNRTITSWGSVFKWPYGTPPVLSTAASKMDVISGIYDGTYIHVSYIRTSGG